MKIPLLLCVAVVLAAIASAVTTALWRAPSAQEVREVSAARAASPEGWDAAKLATAIVQLSERQDELAQALEELRVSVRSARVDAVPTEPVPAASAPAAALTRTEPDKKGSATAAEQISVESALEQLNSGTLDEEAELALWRRMNEAGLVDELVAAIEARAAADPSDPDEQNALGNAYLQKLFTVGNGPEAGVWATKADKAFDAALALDPGHWDARFSKAVSLSFWPPVFGKQAEAIQNFEKLIEQQAGSNEPRYAQSHLLLGNMYLQAGKTEKAIAAWQAGLAIFPEDPALQAQLKLNGGGK